MAIFELSRTGNESELAWPDKGEPRFLVTTFLHNYLLINSVLRRYSRFIFDCEGSSDFFLGEDIEGIVATAVINMPCDDRGSNIGTQRHMSLRYTSSESCLLWLHDTTRWIVKRLDWKRNISNRYTSNCCTGWFTRFAFSLIVRTSLN